MRLRELGKTGLMVSEIGLGGEWLERHNTEEVKEVIDACEKEGINILDCFWPGLAQVLINSVIFITEPKSSRLLSRRQRW